MKPRATTLRQRLTAWRFPIGLAIWMAGALIAFAHVDAVGLPWAVGIALILIGTVVMFRDGNQGH